MYYYSNFSKKQQNQIQKAAAVGFDPSKDVAPKILAKGKGALAEQIIKIAQEHNVAIEQNSELVDILTLLEVDQYIPIEIYSIMAQILSEIGMFNDEISANTK